MNLCGNLIVENSIVMFSQQLQMFFSSSHKIFLLSDWRFLIDLQKRYMRQEDIINNTELPLSAST